MSPTLALRQFAYRLQGKHLYHPQSSWDTRTNTGRAMQHAVRRLGYRRGAQAIDGDRVSRMLTQMYEERTRHERYWWEHEAEEDYDPAWTPEIEAACERHREFLEVVRRREPVIITR